MTENVTKIEKVRKSMKEQEKVRKCYAPFFYYEILTLLKNVVCTKSRSINRFGISARLRNIDSIEIQVIDHGESDSEVMQGPTGSGHIDYCIIIRKHEWTLNP